MNGQVEVTLDKGAVRQTLAALLRDIEGSVAVATSGGVDSSALVVSCLDLGYEPVIMSFKLDNKASVYDFDAAQRLARKFDLTFVPVILPTDAEIVMRTVKDIIRTLRVKNKAAIECLFPMMFMFSKCQEFQMSNLVCGHAADGHYALSKKAMIHYRHSKESFQQFRKEYFRRSNVAQSESLRQLGKQTRVAVHLPYLTTTYFQLFSDLSWRDVNTPRQKELIRRDFPELDDLRLKPHLNLQLGDSGIAEIVGQTVRKYVAPTAKSPVKAYNLLFNKYV